MQHSVHLTIGGDLAFIKDVFRFAPGIHASLKRLISTSYRHEKIDSIYRKLHAVWLMFLGGQTENVVPLLVPVGEGSL